MSCIRNSYFKQLVSSSTFLLPCLSWGLAHSYIFQGPKEEVGDQGSQGTADIECAAPTNSISCEPQCRITLVRTQPVRMQTQRQKNIHFN